MKCDFSDIPAKYDRIVKEYAGKSRDYVSNKEETDKFLEHLPKNAQILDAGCGPGNFVNYFRSKKFGYVGIDFSKEMLKFAKKQHKGANFARMDLRRLGFQRNAFSGIYASYSFLHIPKKDAKAAILGFKRILKPKGVLMLVVIEGMGEKPLGINAKPDMGIEHSLWNLPEMARLLRTCGFEIVFENRRPPRKKRPETLFSIIKIRMLQVLKIKEKPKIDTTANHGAVLVIAKNLKQREKGKFQVRNDS